MKQGDIGIEVISNCCFRTYSTSHSPLQSVAALEAFIHTQYQHSGGSLKCR